MNDMIELPLTPCIHFYVVQKVVDKFLAAPACNQYEIIRTISQY